MNGAFKFLDTDSTKPGIDHRKPGEPIGKSTDCVQDDVISFPIKNGSKLIDGSNDGSFDATAIHRVEQFVYVLLRLNSETQGTVHIDNFHFAMTTGILRGLGGLGKKKEGGRVNPEFVQGIIVPFTEATCAEA